MPTLQNYGRNPADKRPTQDAPKAFLSHSASQILGGACALASPDVRYGMGGAPVT